MIVAILGTTISPYLFFWQANQEVEEKEAAGSGRRRGATETGAELRRLGRRRRHVLLQRGDVLHHPGDGGHAASRRPHGNRLRRGGRRSPAPLAGAARTVLMGLGLVGSGLLAVPILTASGAYALCETFGWKCRLDDAGAAQEFYIVIGLSTAVGLLINFMGINLIDALFWTAVINGFLAPPLLVIIMIVANRRISWGTGSTAWA